MFFKVFLLKFIYFLLIIINISTVFGTSSNNCSVNIVPRRRWGARVSLNVEYQTLPVKYVIIHHTVTGKCSTKSKCSQITANIQSYAIDVLGDNDILYNFLVGNDGNIYEGVGWHKVGAHTYKYNKKSIGIGFIGNFSDELPTDAALQAVKDLLKCGVDTGELDRRYILLGGRQVIASESPGLELYNEIQDWDNWSETP